MSDLWLPGWERDTISNHGGGSYVGDDPWRITLHTTEGSSIAGAVAAYEKHGVPPHGTVDPRTRRRVQHIPLNRSAYALKNIGGGVETNRIHNVQFEIVWFAKDGPLMPDDMLRWLGEEVIAPVRALVPVSLVCPQFVGPESGTIASASARQRFTHDAWRRFNGVCGHQHVPENDHWDPGRLDVPAILRYASGTTPAPPTPEEDEDVFKPLLPVQRGSTGGLYAILPDDILPPDRNSSAVPMRDMNHLNALMNLGLVVRATSGPTHISIDAGAFDGTFGKPDELP